jgi:hypothetical protein
MVNGFEYSWEDVNLVLFGKLIEGIEAVDYSVSKSHTNVYGRGADPVAMGRGKKEYSGRLSILQSEFEAIQARIPAGKDITDVAPFSVTVSYAPEGGAVVTDQLTYVRVSSFQKGMKNGDGNMVIELALVIGKIKLNVK